MTTNTTATTINGTTRNGRWAWCGWVSAALLTIAGVAVPCEMVDAE